MKLLPSFLGLAAAKLSPFSDDILYTLDFVGAEAQLDQTPGVKYDETDYVIMKTPHNEEYKCFIPQDRADNDDEPEDPGPPAEDLLDPLMKVGPNNKKQCTPVRLETYWSYELCHGKHLRQYHEEKIKNGVSTTEYFLGYYNGGLPLERPAEQPKSRKEVKSKMIEGLETPYYEMVFDQGTECKLKPGMKRLARVQYICNPQAHTAEIHSVTETRTCEYEVQVLTATLCKSPLYAQKFDTDTFGIPCQKMGEHTPVAPMGYKKAQPEQAVAITTIDTKTGEIKQISQDQLVDLLKEAAQNPNQENSPISAEQLQKILASVPQDAEPQVVQDNIAKAIMKEVQKQTSQEVKTVKQVKETVQSAKVEQALKKPSAVLDAETKKILHAFLQGEYCLRGGTGWWKYEFCYGKHVMQYHDWPHEAGKPKRERDEIVVGKWVAENHATYAKTKNVVKRESSSTKKGGSTQTGKTAVDEDGEEISVWDPDAEAGVEEGDRVVQVELFYTEGNVCDVTGKPRDVIVRLKCKPGATSLSLYLLEPKTCSYILGLESQLLCQLLTDVDEQGLIQL